MIVFIGVSEAGVNRIQHGQCFLELRGVIFSLSAGYGERSEPKSVSFRNRNYGELPPDPMIYVDYEYAIYFV